MFSSFMKPHDIIEFQHNVIHFSLRAVDGHIEQIVYTEIVKLQTGWLKYDIKGIDIPNPMIPSASLQHQQWRKYKLHNNLLKVKEKAKSQT